VLVEERFGRAAWGPHAERIETKGWRAQLRKISRLALAAGRPWFVFVNSLSDFWDKQADPQLRYQAVGAFSDHPHLTFLLLTKRPQNIVRLFAETFVEQERTPGNLKACWPPNAAIGCTVVTQAEADRDIPVLLAAKAALNPAFAFVSMEPLMGAVDLRSIPIRSGFRLDALNGHAFHKSLDGPWCKTDELRSLDWVITGGETDQGSHKARPSHPDWFRSLRDQCAAAGVAYHHKQNGEWLDHEALVHTDGRGEFSAHAFHDNQIVYRVGKKGAGRALDGAIHDARPAGI
jgi:protein gp37